MYVTDANGVESDPESFTITVEDTTPPDLTYHLIKQWKSLVQTEVVVTFDPPSATDFFEPVTIECTSSDTTEPMH